MADNLNPQLTTEAWADIVIKRWQDAVSKMGLVDTAALLLSFSHYITSNAGGNPQRIIFAFKYYGIFSDMGVGNGVKYDEQAVMHAAGLTSREPKPWYSKSFYAQARKLGELLAEKYALKARVIIVSNISDSK